MFPIVGRVKHITQNEYEILGEVDKKNIEFKEAEVIVLKTK